MTPLPLSISPREFATFNCDPRVMGGHKSYTPSFSFVSESGTRLTLDMRYGYHGNIIFARDWERAGFMPI